jgi:ATP-dependent helicase/nuclease subunit A
MMTALDLANAEQRAASNPATSAFVAASAGTGKTKLLTDRLLRLLLTGTPPSRILCLTYTKAAAAEMAIRLNRRLGAWVVLSDEKLAAELAGLDVPSNQTSRDAARKLFADALDLPGGMRICTIHAFCQSLLRRFPLEAELSPHFLLEDEAEAMARLRESRERILAAPSQRAAITALAAETNEQEFAGLIGQFAAGENDLQGLLRNFTQPGLAAMQAAALGADELDEPVILARAICALDAATLRPALQKIANTGPPKAAEAARRRLDWLSGDQARRIAGWNEWRDSFFGTSRYAPSTIIGKKLLESNPELGTAIAAEQSRIEAIEESRKAAALAHLNANLMQLAIPILQTDAAQKSERATVTYADLISVTLNLLNNPDDVAWILYKLDGGIDHLLLDEVQDTAPAQWQIADAIAGEFFTGSGARDSPRTIFAVGDSKQSIFSFQGADLHSFETYRAKFSRRVREAGQNWLDGKLSVSFRSTGPVLALVDAVFGQGPACEGVCAPGDLSHGVSRIGQAGAVTLWPPQKPAPASPPPDWTVPESYAGAESAKGALAKQIAAHIKQSLEEQKFLASRNRPVTPGDYLVLVRRRDELVTAITRACKEQNIPVAGLDRMVLTEQQAVSDLLALCDCLLLPQDDLAFGQFLASPLGGLTDASLMELALNRHGTLASTLFARRGERADWSEANALFQVLRARVDFISPHALLAEALGPLGGRAKLLQRLGAEAAEPIDELLAEALAHGRKNPASLQGFLFRLRQSGASIKREAETGGAMVRIMTVHGAKGLQAPIVILPDTTALPRPADTLFWLDVPQQNRAVPIFCPRADLRSEAVMAATAASKTARHAELNRLLYVALTRAEDELIICGAEGRKPLPDTCWYNLVRAGFARLGSTAADDGTLSYETPQTAPPDRAETSATSLVANLPAWAGSPPAWRAVPPNMESTRPEPLAPSRNTDDPPKLAIAASPLGEGLAGLRAARAAAMAKGRAIHALLQHLPDAPVSERRAIAANYTAQSGLALDAQAQTRIVDSVLSILENPALGPLFGPESRPEVPLAGVLGGVEVGGLVDRLAVGPGKILLADYKTDRAPPATADAVPPAYVRQLSAYEAILRQIFPAKQITCLLIWTENATLMELPPPLLARHAPAQAQP